jgi:hypothetical protein
MLLFHLETLNCVTLFLYLGWGVFVAGFFVFFFFFFFLSCCKSRPIVYNEDYMTVGLESVCHLLILH